MVQSLDGFAEPLVGWHLYEAGEASAGMSELDCRVHRIHKVLKQWEKSNSQWSYLSHVKTNVARIDPIRENTDRKPTSAPVSL